MTKFPGRPIDRISDLPNAIIQHILSFLPVKDVIRFCSLSRQWNSLWTSVPNLSFHCESNNPKEALSLAASINKSLMKYTSRKIKKFSLNMFYFYILERRIESWLRFATSLKVEKLCLEFSSIHYNTYKLPMFLYTNHSVTEMSLHLVSLPDYGGGVCWTSLKVLTLSKSRISREMIRAILLGSPLIESLTLHGYGGIIDARGTSLKELVIDNRTWIFAPNHLSLNELGTFDTAHLRLDDVSSLNEVGLYYITRGRGFEERKIMLKGVLRQFSHVFKLAVGICCLQDLSVMKLRGTRISPSTRKIIEVEMELTKGYLPGLMALLHSSPDVEQLNINVMPLKDEFHPDGLDYDENISKKYYVIRHLKSVEIKRLVVGSSSDEILVELVQHLLANATMLEKLIIHVEVDRLTSKPKEPKKLLEIKQILLCHPRASPDAEILFKRGVF